MESNVQFNFEASTLLRTAIENPQRFSGFVVPDNGLFPEIRKGDVVIYDAEEKLQETGIFAVNAGDLGRIVMRFQRTTRGTVKGISAYPEKDVVELEGEPDLLGRVVMIFRRIPE